MTAKFEFTGETKIVSWVTLRRIRALRAIGDDVKPGDLGGWVGGWVDGWMDGWIEHERNLSQGSGDAWMTGNARVFGDTWLHAEPGEDTYEVGPLERLARLATEPVEV